MSERVETILHFPSMLAADSMSQDLFEMLYFDDRLTDAIGLHLTEDEWERADSDRGWRDDELLSILRDTSPAFAVSVASPVEDSWGHTKGEWRTGSELGPLLPRG